MAKYLVEDNNCVHVKIIATICSEVIYQILDEKYYDLGENGWDNNKAKLNHAFFSYLNSTDMDYLNKLAVATVIGRELDVKIVVENTSDFNCASCKPRWVRGHQENIMLNLCSTVVNKKKAAYGCLYIKIVETSNYIIPSIPPPP